MTDGGESPRGAGGGCRAGDAAVAAADIDHDGFHNCDGGGYAIVGVCSKDL